MGLVKWKTPSPERATNSGFNRVKSGRYFYLKGTKIIKISAIQEIEWKSRKNKFRYQVIEN